MMSTSKYQPIRLHRPWAKISVAIGLGVLTANPSDARCTSESSCRQLTQDEALIYIEKVYDCGNDLEPIELVSGQGTIVTASGYVLTAAHVACKDEADGSSILTKMAEMMNQPPVSLPTAEQLAETCQLVELRGCRRDTSCNLPLEMRYPAEQSSLCVFARNGDEEEALKSQFPQSQIIRDDRAVLRIQREEDLIDLATPNRCWPSIDVLFESPGSVLRPPGSTFDAIHLYLVPPLYKKEHGGLICSRGGAERRRPVFSELVNLEAETGNAWIKATDTRLFEPGDSGGAVIRRDTNRCFMLGVLSRITDELSLCYEEAYAIPIVHFYDLFLRDNVVKLGENARKLLHILLEDEDHSHPRVEVLDIDFSRISELELFVIRRRYKESTARRDLGRQAPQLLGGLGALGRQEAYALAQEVRDNLIFADQPEGSRIVSALSASLRLSTPQFLANSARLANLDPEAESPRNMGLMEPIHFARKDATTLLLERLESDLRQSLEVELPVRLVARSLGLDEDTLLGVVASTIELRQDPPFGLQSLDGTSTDIVLALQEGLPEQVEFPTEVRRLAASLVAEYYKIRARLYLDSAMELSKRDKAREVTSGLRLAQEARRLLEEYATSEKEREYAARLLAKELRLSAVGVRWIESGDEFVRKGDDDAKSFGLRFLAPNRIIRTDATGKTVEGSNAAELRYDMKQ